MAVKKQQKFAHDFWILFKRSVTIVAILVQVVILGTVAAVLYVTGFFEQQPLVYAAVLLALAVLGTVGSVIIYTFASRPLKDIMAAVLHISGEPSEIGLPNPNTSYYAKTGFRDVLQTIYSLAVRKSEPASAKVAAAPAGATVDVLSAALDGTHCGIILMNHAREILYANKTAPIDINQDGKNVLRLIFGGTNTLDQWLDECDANAVHAEHTWSRVADRLPEVDGRRFFDVIASYNKESANEIIITLVDRTSIYEVGEEELDFIAFAAHELRGPITVIRGYLDVLQDELQDVLADDQKELFHRLTVSANRLTGYVNNILNTSRYDRRHLRVRLHEITLASVYETIRDDMDMRAAAQGRLLSVNIPEELPKVAGDTASLSEVFSNLIDNAIKYSNEGGAIAVTTAVAGDFVEVAIEDHGIGMPSTVISNLFNKFYRSHRSRETVAGTGIGLYISKALVESHGGIISVRSEEGRGSTFTVSLPTYASVANTLRSGHNSNEDLIEQGSGWISNHSMYRG
jgi:signal transduction histidine kinase